MGKRASLHHRFNTFFITFVKIKISENKSDFKKNNYWSAGLDFADIFWDQFLQQQAFERTSGQSQIVAILPKFIDQRMVAQQSRLTIHAKRDPLDNEPGNDKYLWKIKIPAQHKNALRTSLSRWAFDEFAAFPDLEHLADHISERRFFRQ